jgi:hypothetical protein
MAISEFLPIAEVSPIIRGFLLYTFRMAISEFLPIAEVSPIIRGFLPYIFRGFFC